MKIVNLIPEPLVGKVLECDHQTETELRAAKLTGPSAHEGRDCVENSISEEPRHVEVEGSEARGWEGQVTDWKVAAATSMSGYSGYCEATRSRIRTSLFPDGSKGSQSSWPRL